MAGGGHRAQHEPPQRGGPVSDLAAAAKEEQRARHGQDSNRPRRESAGVSGLRATEERTVPGSCSGRSASSQVRGLCSEAGRPRRALCTFFRRRAADRRYGRSGDEAAGGAPLPHPRDGRAGRGRAGGDPGRGDRGRRGARAVGVGGHGGRRARLGRRPARDAGQLRLHERRAEALLRHRLPRGRRRALRRRLGGRRAGRGTQAVGPVGARPVRHRRRRPGRGGDRRSAPVDPCRASPRGARRRGRTGPERRVRARGHPGRPPLRLSPGRRPGTAHRLP
ncbi:hypothetical protein NOCARDAX2BIS_200036 [Nocardioides sp. AX2bis]|nr:hypothetical protein NOCARDAX2BIS_200036 [Nocardioides sp. AX2bis]